MSSKKNGQIPDEDDSSVDSDTNASHSSQSSASMRISSSLEGNLKDHQPKIQTDMKVPLPPNKGPMLVFIRNSEHMNKCFPEWITKNLMDEKYKITDMNQPKKLYSRASPVPNYGLDPPLTVFGGRLAALLGRCLASTDVLPIAIYCSPALRCIETAWRMIQGQNTSLKIRIEPGLYDFRRQPDLSFPTFMTAEELAASDIPVDLSYKPILDMRQLETIFNSENPLSFARRSQEIVQTIVKNQKPQGIIWVVSHACTIHVAARALTGQSLTRKGEAIYPIATVKELNDVNLNYPYCTLLALKPAAIEENAKAVASSSFTGGKRYHALGCSSVTSKPSDAQWIQMAGLMPHFNSSGFNNRFNHAFFVNPSGKKV